MDILTPFEMQAADKYTIENIGIPGIVLMENAAVRVFDEIVASLESVRGKRTVVFAGKGNNGGDAFAVARHLYNNGAIVRVYVLALKSTIKGDALTNLNIIENLGIDVVELDIKNEKNLEEIEKKEKIDILKTDLSHAQLIVDGIFGTGFSGKINPPLTEIIDMINESAGFVVSIDIPSGVNGENGKVETVAVKADKTVALAYLKTGLVVHPGCDYTGKTVVVDIGIKKTDSLGMVLQKDKVAKLLPKREHDSSKFDYGRVLVISGSKGMTGAGFLCAKAVLRSGAGLVYLAVPESLMGIYAELIPEAVLIPLSDKDGFFSSSCINEIEKYFSKVKSIVIGPGISINPSVVDLLRVILERSTVPLVIDADALNCISIIGTEFLKNVCVPVAVTPHEGEMERLTGIERIKIHENRICTALDFAKEYNVVTVLKGSRTVIASSEGKYFINTTGNSGMATAGAGDVLAGMLGAFVAQGVEMLDASCLSVFLHGLSGDIASSYLGEYGMTAADILKYIPEAIIEISKYKNI